MGFQYSSLQSTEVTISGGVTLNPFVTIPNTDQTLANFSHRPVDNQVMYTVPAGKTFYLMGLVWTPGGAAAVVLVYKNDGATTITQLGSASVTSANIPNGSCPIAVYTENQSVRASATAGELSGWGILI